MSSCSEIVYYASTEEYLIAEVTADVQLSGQPVAMSFDQDTWFPAEWIGSAATTRQCRALVGADGGPQWPSPERWPVYVRVTDNPEIPVKHAGTIQVR